MGNPRPTGTREARASRPDIVARNARYYALRETGVSATEAAKRIGISSAIAEHLEALRRAEQRTMKDASCPSLGDHDGHIRAVVAKGGFPRLSEKIGKAGHPVACLPIIHFGGASCVS